MGTEKYSNNPWDYQESILDYSARKKLQFDFIVERIKRGEVTDLICLQEVDFMTSKEKARLSKAFEKKLQELGWELISTRAADQSRPLLMLFNTARLKRLTESQPVVAVEKNAHILHCGQQVGFQINSDKFSDVAVRVTNLHLLFDQPIPPALFEMSPKEKTIELRMGDINHHHPDLAVSGIHSAPDGKATVICKEGDDFCARSMDVFWALVPPGWQKRSNVRGGAVLSSGERPVWSGVF